jgi:hypothetical protein
MGGFRCSDGNTVVAALWGVECELIVGEDSSRTDLHVPPAAADGALLRRGFALEYATLGWNVVGIVVLALAAWSARSVALAGFGLDSLIEIGASIVVVWDLSVIETRRGNVGRCG